MVGAIATFGALMLSVAAPGRRCSPMMAVVALAGLADGPGLAATFATRQRYVPAELLGQVFTTGAGLKVGVVRARLGRVGPVVLAAGSAGALLIAAAMQFVAAATGVLLMRARRARARRRPCAEGSARRRPWRAGARAARAARPRPGPAASSPRMTMAEKSISHGRSPCRAEVGKAWWLLCHDSPKDSGASHRRLRDSSSVSNRRRPKKWQSELML